MKYKKNKKITCFVVFVVVCILLCSCGSVEKDDTAKAEENNKSDVSVEKVDYKNSMEYSRYTTDKKYVHKIKNQIDFDILDKRNLKDIHKKKYSKKEQIVDLSKAFLGYASAKTVTIKKSLAEVETEKYYDKFSKKAENNSQQSFLATLIHNLKSSCN